MVHMLNVIDPTNEEIVGDYTLNSPEEIEERIQKGYEAFQVWEQKSFAERSKYLQKIAALLIENTEKYARLMTREMGKPITEARAEVKKCALACNYFAEHGESFLKEKVIREENQTGFVAFEPMGLILGIMPWNFPFWQVFRFLAPTLMAGNAILIKHALNVPGCALAIEELMQNAGFPKNLVRNVFVEHELIQSLIEHPLIRGVSLTGSERAGESVGATAGRMLKKCVFELGGSDPFIVFEDANLNKCIQTAITARLGNAGQSCIAAKRFIVVRSQMEPFCKQLLEGLKSVKIGDPIDDETTMGPLARKDLFEKFSKQVEHSINKGAKLLVGGKPLDRKGYFYPPTVLTNVKKGMPAFDEETFGPLFAIIEAKDADQAIELANESPYGLGASLWTENLKEAKTLARKIQSGMVFINAKTVSDPKYPFGGIKRSGFGRELGEEGIKEFVNVKTVIIRGK